MMLINVARLLIGAEFITQVMGLSSQCRCLPHGHARQSLFSRSKHTWRIANFDAIFPSKVYVGTFEFEAHTDTLDTGHLHRQEGIQRSGQNVGLVGSPLN